MKKFNLLKVKLKYFEIWKPLLICKATGDKQSWVYRNYLQFN